MAIKFQYNKTALGDLDKQLKVRRRALPTIKSKESALRVEVKRAKTTAEGFRTELDDLSARHEYMVALWGEFDPELVRIDDVRLVEGKIAGVKVPVLEGVDFSEKEYDLFSSPAWTTDGVELVKSIGRLVVESAVYMRRAELLDRARKKTTQKVNLYEKVQIPGYEEAILKIKRFLEDEENLSKSSQKIVKQRHQQEDKKMAAKALEAGKEAAA
ncbi:MAG: V-type ATP synthase subunit D [Alistipes sp.]|jgi:V/A-type H+-transporting ATPase subunit D|nr:V-type ATP synthase subunit D [Alistipes sp.]